MLHALCVDPLHHTQVLFALTFGSVVDASPVQTENLALFTETQSVLRGD